jgi:transposase
VPNRSFIDTLFVITQYLRCHGIRISIPRKQNEDRTGPFDRTIYRLRERVERLINRLKQHRRLATRYEKCAVNSHAMKLIAATLLWLEFANTP